MGYKHATVMRELIKSQLDDAQKSVDQFPKRPDGSHSDEVRRDPNYQKQKARLHAAFRSYQNINAYMVRNYKAEMAAERKEKRNARNNS